MEPWALSGPGWAGRNEERQHRGGYEVRITGAANFAVRLFVSGGRLYSVSVTGNAPEVETPEAVHFLDSFELTSQRASIVVVDCLGA